MTPLLRRLISKWQILLPKALYDAATTLHFGMQSWLDFRKTHCVYHMCKRYLGSWQMSSIRQCLLIHPAYRQLQPQSDTFLQHASWGRIQESLNTDYHSTLGWTEFQRKTAYTFAFFITGSINPFRILCICLQSL